MQRHQMTDAYQQIESEEIKLFNKICELAVAGNVDELQKEIQAGTKIDMIIFKQSPASFLAKQNEKAAVKLLVTQFKADSSEALNGAIDVNDDKTDNVINEELINFLLKSDPDNILKGIEHAARAGNIKMTHYLLKCVKSDEKKYQLLFDVAMCSAALGAKTKLINSLIRVGKVPNLDKIAENAYYSKALFNDKILHFVSHINDAPLRASFLGYSSFKESISTTEYQLYLTKSEKLNTLMIENDLTYDEAMYYLNVKPIHWLIGQSLIKQGIISSDIYFLIAAAMIDSTNYIAGKKIMITANQRLTNRIINAFNEKIDKNIKNNIVSFFKPKKIEQKKLTFAKKQKERMKPRLTF
jgi:hypothetical protein